MVHKFVCYDFLIIPVISPILIGGSRWESNKHFVDWVWTGHPQPLGTNLFANLLAKGFLAETTFSVDYEASGIIVYIYFYEHKYNLTDRYKLSTKNL